VIIFHLFVQDIQKFYAQRYRVCSKYIENYVKRIMHTIGCRSIYDQFNKRIYINGLNESVDANLIYEKIVTDKYVTRKSKPKNSILFGFEYQPIFNF